MHMCGLICHVCRISAIPATLDVTKIRAVCHLCGLEESRAACLSLTPLASAGYRRRDREKEQIACLRQAYETQTLSAPSIASADMDLNQLEAFLTAQTKKQGGITSDQAAVIAKFWKNHRIKIRESLINQSRWDNVLKNMNWRVDLKSQSRHIDQINTPVAIVEMELGRNGQESEFLCLEFDEAKVNQMLKKLSEIEESMTSLTQAT
ncbi:COMM domain-containing protein 1 isoform X1 [Struthio camelus]|uniref:COMM domain-containing protein 1 isoform X1 n=1 Tax=Struthio camelus TaxID=8801 RepID=UPI003603B6C9